ncbi:cobalamin-dependent protein [Candidatus Leptofilum sp.]|uniref:cobalamin-dependent protein n=1 Tax=Candidatus Leptofilum sp. TaxID=3241576 RepID=UPI003B58FEAF
MDERTAPIKILLAKTALDGHWRGINVVARALRDAGFEIILVGMAKAEEIVHAALTEDVDLIGLNVGGRIEVVERILAQLETAELDIPVFAGGTISPKNCRRLNEQGVETYPPGSSLHEIVAAAERLTKCAM